MPLHTLILGHSICRRLYEHLNTGIDPRHRSDLNISKSSTIDWHGIGGRTIDKVIKHDMHVVTRQRTDCIVLMIGGNDVLEDITAEEVAFKLLTFGTVLTKKYGIRRVVICALLPRFPKAKSKFKHTSFAKRRAEIAEDQSYKSMYAVKAHEINSILKNEALSYNKISFWDHNERFYFQGIEKQSCIDKFNADGVHLNNKGQYHLYRSLRGAVINASKHI